MEPAPTSFAQKRSARLAPATLELGEGLRLRGLRSEDAGALFELVEGHRLLLGRYLAFVHEYKSLADAQFFVHSFTKEDLYGTGLIWAIEADSKFCGTVGFHLGSLAHRRAEIGYWLGPPFWGRGLAGRSLQAAIAHVFAKGLHRITARVSPDNERSLKVLARFGFQFEGLERQSYNLGGSFVDLQTWSLLKPEWAASRC